MSAPGLVQGAPRDVVDTHVHVWPHGLVHPGQIVKTPLAATPADLLATMVGSGVAVTVMSPANIYPANEYALGAAATVPDRLRAVVGIDPRADDAPATLAAHTNHGAIGVRIPPGSLPLVGPDDFARLGALVDVAADLGLVVQWTARLSLTKPIEFVAARRPTVVQVLDHLGLPENARDLRPLDRIRALAAIPTLTIKLSGMYALSTDGYPYADTWPWAEGVLDAFGPDRTMWASDWPLSGESASQADLVALIDRLSFLDAAARTAIFCTTARRVWDLGPASAGASVR
jgi:predicted TIM-barrel fold metal-dependent hydrolase